MTDNRVFLLPKAQHQTIFQEEIAPIFLHMAEPREQPIALITGGQPASGKTILAGRLQQQFISQGGVVRIDSDRLRPYSTHYAQLLQEKNLAAANLTHQDAGQWAVQLLELGVAKNYNLLIDQTSRDSQRFQLLCKKLRSHGYRIEFHIMAVSYLTSRLNALSRYCNQLAIAGVGRNVTPNKVQEAFAGISQTLQLTEQHYLVDQISIYNFQFERMANKQRVAAEQWDNATLLLDIFIKQRDTLTCHQQQYLRNTFTEAKQLISDASLHLTEQDRLLFAEIEQILH